ncbi:hypothetical protein E2562_038082 [Oryza meyeriana var. granulata]|uniref:Uncharacterized protein n=1 Tax=Oryza meyeriana var. granulata TaxID=110450 RepID=A0A6G1EU53_9ORYZ|nr:hypothetical protein E2562_038082 [Oryza meyeriana var. granulata]
MTSSIIIMIGKGKNNTAVMTNRIALAFTMTMKAGVTAPHGAGLHRAIGLCHGIGFHLDIELCHDITMTLMLNIFYKGSGGSLCFVHQCQGIFFGTIHCEALANHLRINSGVQ